LRYFVQILKKQIYCLFTTMEKYAGFIKKANRFHLAVFNRTFKHFVDCTLEFLFCIIILYVENSILYYLFSN